MYSLVIPVYRNEGSIPELVDAVTELDGKLGGRLEVVFVVDGSPDRCAELLRERLPALGVEARLLVLSRNFGSFPAVRAGLAEAQGPYYATLAADLQEPPELVLSYFQALESGEVDVALGQREGRDDPLISRLSSSLFWFLYRRFVQREMPKGGVDSFGCNQAFRDRLLALEESNSTLVGLIFWLGFRRKLIPYRRHARRHGRSAWTLGKKTRYLLDSVFAFSDLPIRLLVLLGGLGLMLSVSLSLVVVLARFTGTIEVPGYAATVLVISFFAALNSFGLGILGSYVWRAFENTKGRPQVVVMDRSEFKRERY
jgi:glycosyltransferase involved in cell wall biosynthesis